MAIRFFVQQYNNNNGSPLRYCRDGTIESIRPHPRVRRRS